MNKNIKQKLQDATTSFSKAVAGVNLKDLIIDSSIHPLISDAIIQMITSHNLPYYGEFTQAINFKSANIGTCGVNVTTRGMNFYWDPKFIDRLTNEEMIFIIIHELFHLMFDHNKRGIGYDHKIANLAQDMIINSIIHGDMIIGEGLDKIISMPKNELGHNTGVFLPADYPGEPIFEDLYVFVMAKFNKWENENADKIAERKKNQQITIDKDGNYKIGDSDEKKCGACHQTIDESKKVEDVDQDPNKKYCPKCKQEIVEKESQDYKDGKKDGKKDAKKDKKEQGKQDKKDQKGKGDKGQQDPNGKPQPGDGEQEGENGQPQPGKSNSGNQDYDQGYEDGYDGEGQGEGQGEGSGQGQPGGGQSQESQYDENGGKSGDNGQNQVGQYSLDSFFENIENNQGQTMDVHFEDDVSPEVKKQMVESQMQSLKSRGLQSGSVEKILQKLRKQRKDYLKEIKRSMSNMIFGTKKRKSITRLHRKGIWGLKGQRKYKTRINCLLDTSGSMGGDFEKVLSYIFQNDIEINMLQVDTEIKASILIKKKSDLEKMTINGLGGTCLTPGLQYIANDKELNKVNTVILTDGYTDSLDLTGVKGKVLVLSTGIECPVVVTSSKLKQIIIDKEQYV